MNGINKKGIPVINQNREVLKNTGRFIEINLVEVFIYLNWSLINEIVFSLLAASFNLLGWLGTGPFSTCIIISSDETVLYLFKAGSK